MLPIHVSSATGVEKNALRKGKRKTGNSRQVEGNGARAGHRGRANHRLAISRSIPKLLLPQSPESIALETTERLQAACRILENVVPAWRR